MLIRLSHYPSDAAQQLPSLDAGQLNAHPAGHPNSIAWLLWHTGRQIDVQLAALRGRPELWDDFRATFALGELGDSLGYGHSRTEAAGIVVDNQQLLLDYLEATLEAYRHHVTTLNPSEMDEVIDTQWDPPVTRGVRLLSILDDAIAHIGQAAYAAGMLTAPDSE